MSNASVPLVSVIVLNWNGQHFLENCFRSLERQTFKDFETILADNNSTDTSVQFTREGFPNVIIHQLEKNKGYVGANNSAAKVARGKYLFFLNNDTKVDEYCLQELVLMAEADSSIGVLGCKELTYDEGKLISEGVSADIFGYPCAGKNTFYADGAALFIRADLFHQLNGFDGKHFIFFEDMDIGWRVWLSGYKVGYQPGAIVYHKIGGSLKNEYGKAHYITTIFRRYTSERNNLRNIIKNYSIHTLIWILPLYLLLNIVEMMFLCCIGRPKVVYSVYLKSWLYNIKMLPDTLGQRRLVQKMRKVNDLFIFKKMEWKIGKLEALLCHGIPNFISR